MRSKTYLKYILLIERCSENMHAEYILIVAATEQIELLVLATMLANNLFGEAMSRNFCETMKHYLTGS